MRATILITLLAPICSSAQSDYLANDPIWTLHSVCNDPNSGCLTTDDYNYVLGGDTLIQGQSYVKVLRTGMESYMWTGPPPPPLPPPTCTGSLFYPAYVYGFIRQDGYKLFAWYEDADQLLFDFDLEVGSDLPLTLTNWNTDITVSAVDSFLVGAEWRKRFTLENSWAQYMLEGIGSSHGLFEPISNFFDCGYGLTCFGLGSEAFYPEAGPACALITAVNDADLPSSILRVYPNPVRDELSIRVPYALIGSELIVRDASGRGLLRARITGVQMIMDVRELPGGVYTLVLDGQVERFVVSR